MTIKQTAIEWIISQIVEDQTIKAKSMSEWISIFEQAKEMEKQQIIDACNYGDFEELGEKYYTETYGGNNHLCCTPIGQIKRYVNCIGCDRKPLTYGGNK